MSEAATRQVNAALSRVLTPTQPSSQQRSRKRKAYSVFSDEQRATIGKYAAENSTAAAENSTAAAVKNNSIVVICISLLLLIISLNS